MICLVCRQAETVEGVTLVVLERGEFRLAVNGVPARVCPICAEAYMAETIAIQLLKAARRQHERGVIDAHSEYGALQI